MQDIYLSFQDETEANSVLYTFIPATLDENGEIVAEGYLTPNYQNIDVIGVVYKRPPVPTPEDYVPEPYPAPNWGVNIRLLDGENMEPLSSFIVNPKQPIRVWA